MPQGYGLGMKLWYLAVPGTDLSQYRIAVTACPSCPSYRDSWCLAPWGCQTSIWKRRLCYCRINPPKKQGIDCEPVGTLLSLPVLEDQKEDSGEPYAQRSKETQLNQEHLSEFHFELHFTEVGLLCPRCWSWLPSRWLLINVTLCQPPAYLNSTSSIFPRARTPVHQVTLEKQLMEAQTITVINRKTLKLKTQKGNEQTV